MWPALNRQTDRHDVPAGGVGLPPGWVSGVGVREGARSGSPLPLHLLSLQPEGWAPLAGLCGAGF